MSLAETLAADIVAIGVLGPGISGWPQAHAVLRGSAPYVSQPTIVPLSSTLPPAERRRAIRVVNLALAVGHEATTGTGLDLSDLPSVFASSVSDTHNGHELLQTLATADRQVSPTRFHNSVHNVTGGYWSIATRNRASYTMVCGYDGSFSVGLLEALSLVVVGGRAVMLIAYDLDYPSPLREKRAIADAFAIALLLRPTAAGCLASVVCSLTAQPATAMLRPEFESLRLSAPAARALPLLELIASGQPGAVNLEYLDNSSLAVRLTPCS
jgi:hypothetical protein